MDASDATNNSEFLSSISKKSALRAERPEGIVSGQELIGELFHGKTKGEMEEARRQRALEAVAERKRKGELRRLKELEVAELRKQEARAPLNTGVTKEDLGEESSTDTEDVPDTWDDS